MTSPPHHDPGSDNLPDRPVFVLEQVFSASEVDRHDYTASARELWHGRWFIAVATILATIAAVAYALLATEWYRAEVVLIPRESRPWLGLSPPLAQFGGPAEIASSARQEPLGVLRSKGFARRFIERNNLVGILAPSTAGLLDEVSGNSSADIRLVTDRFTRSLMSVVEDKKTGLVTVSVRWKDPKTAAAWANAIAAQVNEEMRARALAEGTRNINYLTRQLAETRTVSVQESIGRLLETEIQKVMLAKGTDEYAFRVVDAAVPPAKRDSPQRKVLVIGALLAGLLASTVWVLVRAPVKRFLAAARSG